MQRVIEESLTDSSQVLTSTWHLCDGLGTICSWDKQLGSLDNQKQQELDTPHQTGTTSSGAPCSSSTGNTGHAAPGCEQQCGCLWSHGPSGFPHPHGLPFSLLQHLLSTLLLRGKAGNGPDFDLNAVVELLPSHVPHALVGSCNGPVLQGKQRVRAQPQPARPRSPGAPARAGAVLPVPVLELELTPW